MTQDGHPGDGRAGDARSGDRRNGDRHNGDGRAGDGPPGDPPRSHDGAAPHPSRAAFSPVGPHPTDDGVVGTYVHTYDPPRQQYQTQLPSMRPAQDTSGGYSTTPIYDALYSEYLRSFRTLPGDRTGEESLGFTAFGTGLHGSHRSYPHTPYTGGWQSDGRQYPGGRAQVALPPAPRRGV